MESEAGSKRGWKTMEISGGVPFLASSVFLSSFNLVDVWKRHRGIILAMVGTSGILLLINSFLSSRTNSVPSDSHSNKKAFSHLRNELRKKGELALKEGIVSPLQTSFEIFEDHGVEFILSKADESSATKKEGTGTIGDKPPSDFDPFDSKNLDKRMVVADVPPDHTLLLNKFYTMPDHALLITKEWQSQSSQLTQSDLTALFDIISALPAIGFYNSGADAGASQAHKHMQMVPLDVLRQYRPESKDPLPIEVLITKQKAAHQPGEVFMLPEFRFRHGVMLLSPTALSSWKTDHLFNEYQKLLMYTGISSQSEDDDMQTKMNQSYNFLLSKEWMMIVSRKQREFAGVDVNAMGFIGCILARGPEAIQNVHSLGPLNILEGVSMGQ